MTPTSPYGRVPGWIAVFLAVSYVIGGPATAVIEWTRGSLSQRFGYPPEVIYLVGSLQLFCGVAVLLRPYASLAAGVLSVLTVGAIVSHLRIGSPLTALPALVYTALQVWLGLARLDDARTAWRGGGP